MLKKIGAVLLVLGVCLPHWGGYRPITDAWSDVPSILFVGVPVLAIVAYALHGFVPPLADFHRRQGQGLHGLLRVVYFVLVGGYLAHALSKESAGWPGPVDVLVAFVATGGLLYWLQGRGTKAERLPLLLLICAGVPTIGYFVSALLAGGLVPGHLVLLAGYAIATAAEVQGLRAAPKIAHGG